MTSKVVGFLSHMVHVSMLVFTMIISFFVSYALIMMMGG